jgi:hypothetical protein
LPGVQQKLPKPGPPPHCPHWETGLVQTQAEELAGAADDVLEEDLHWLSMALSSITGAHNGLDVLVDVAAELLMEDLPRLSFCRACRRQRKLTTTAWC